MVPPPVSTHESESAMIRAFAFIGKGKSRQSVNSVLIMFFLQGLARTVRSARVTQWSDERCIFVPARAICGFRSRFGPGFGPKRTDTLHRSRKRKSENQHPALPRHCGVGRRPPTQTGSILLEPHRRQRGLGLNRATSRHGVDSVQTVRSVECHCSDPTGLAGREGAILGVLFHGRVLSD